MLNKNAPVMDAVTTSLSSRRVPRLGRTISDMFEDELFEPAYVALPQQPLFSHIRTTRDNTGLEKSQMVAETWQPSSAQSCLPLSDSHSVSAPMQVASAKETVVAKPFQSPVLCSARPAPQQFCTRANELQQWAGHLETLFDPMPGSSMTLHNLMVKSATKPPTYIGTSSTATLSTQHNTLLKDHEKGVERSKAQTHSAYAAEKQVGDAFPASQQVVLDLSSNASARSKGQALRRRQPALSEEARKTRCRETRRKRDELKKQSRTGKDSL